MSYYIYYEIVHKVHTNTKLWHPTMAVVLRRSLGTLGTQ